MAKTATVVLMCGPPGAGKTTYAKTLERTGHVRLSVDEEKPGPNSANVGPAYLDKFLAGFEAPGDEGEKVIRV